MKLRYALRSLKRDRSFSILVFFIACLSLSACSAVFSLIYVFVLKPVNFSEPERIVDIQPEKFAEIEEYPDWIQPAQTMEAVAPYKVRAFYLKADEERMRLPGYFVTSKLFSVLRASPMLGPGFTAANDHPGGEPVVMLSYGLWQGVFHEDRNIIGKVVQLNFQPHTIVGVMPEDFGFRGQLWVSMANALQKGPGISRQVFLIGRLKAGMTPQQASTEFTARGKGIHGPKEKVTVEPYSWGAADDYKQILSLLLSATIVVLLICSLNIGNLVLMRAIARGKDMAINMALGATRAAIIRKTFMELVFILVPAGLIGLLISFKVLSVMKDLFPSYISGYRALATNSNLWLFAFLLAVLMAVICSVIPILRLKETNLSDALKDTGQSSSNVASSRLRPFALVLQIALGAMLLAGAGLMLQSVRKLYAVNPGFDTSHVLTGFTALPHEKYPDEKNWSVLYARMIDAARQDPGVTNVAFTNGAPLWGTMAYTNIQTSPNSPRIETYFHTVSPEYFQLLKLHILAGRVFLESDTVGSQPVMVINETLAKRLGKNILGSTVGLIDEELPENHIVIGVVNDVRHLGLSEPPAPEIYVPLWQHSWKWGMLLIRTADDPNTHFKAFVKVVESADPDIQVVGVSTMDELASGSIEQSRFLLALLSVFGGLALFLMLFGIYAVFSYAVTQRRREIGIRMAVGAAAKDILMMLYKESILFLLLGIAGGAALSLNTIQALRAYLFEVTPYDPITLLSVAACIMIMGFASVLPSAIRAVRTNPMDTLRVE